MLPASPSIRCQPGFSRRFAVLIGVLYAGAGVLASVVIAPLDYAAGLLIALWGYLAWDAWRVFQVHVRQQHPWLPSALVIRDELVVLSDEQFAHILPDSLVHSSLIVLRLRLSNGRLVSCVLFSDALPADDFRRLCIHLRHGVKFAQPRSKLLDRVTTWRP